MINAEVLELKKRFRKDRASFYRMAGCYVNEKKEKVYTFNQSFLNLPEPEMFQYLDIANKLLSGKIGNNLLNLEFPYDAAQTGGAQRMLCDLRESECQDDEMLTRLYDKIINNYQHMNNYLIVLFFDKYDIPMKTKDKINLGDSEEVFHYVLCGICPVELTKPNLGFIDRDNGLSITGRDWVVQMPESGFMFPAFNERSTDVNSVLFYTKNAKLPHEEMIADVLDCDFTLTSSQKKERFNTVIREKLDDTPNEEIDNIIIDMEYRLNQMVEAHKSEHGEAAILRVKKNVLQAIVEDVAIPDEKKDDVVEVLNEIFEDTNTDASTLVSAGNMRLGEERAAKKVLVGMLCQKEKELESLKGAEPERTYETKVINGMKYMLVPTEKNTTVIDGIEYVMIPAKND